MKKKLFNPVFFISVVLILSMLSGCIPGMTDDSGETEAGKTTAPVETQTTAPDTTDEETDETPPETSEPDVDFSDPEEVLLAFWDEHSATRFSSAERYLSTGVSDTYSDFRSAFEANPYALQLWEFIVGDTSLTITGRGSSGDDWVIFNLVVEQKEFEEIFSHPDGPETIEMLMALLFLSGFEMGPDEGEMEDVDITFSDELWDETFATLREIAEDLPMETINVQIELVLEDGEWKVDEVPFLDLFS